MRVVATHLTDPGCPWAYSARPWHAKLAWRFGDQLDWRLVMIGLAESPERYERRGYTPDKQAAGFRRFAERFGMPFAYEPKARIAATSRACRAIVAARELSPQAAERALRALQFLHFATAERLDDDVALQRALTGAGLDGDAIVARIDSAELLAAYENDRALARSAEGGPTDIQGRAAQTDGPVRYTAPSVIFTDPAGASIEVGGFQPFEAYDTAVANFAPELERRPEPDDAAAALAAFPDGLTTAEVAWVRKTNLGALDLAGTRAALEELAAAGAARRTPLGDDALWHAG